jgi:hypothetical protein
VWVKIYPKSRGDVARLAAWLGRQGAIRPWQRSASCSTARALPSYRAAIGIPWLRTGAWAVSVLGLILIFLQLIG